MKHLAIGNAFAAMLVFAITGAGRVAASGDTPPPPSSPKFYSTRVTDILNNNCLSCHDETAKGGLRLDSYAGIMKGGDGWRSHCSRRSCGQHADPGHPAQPET